MVLAGSSDMAAPFSRRAVREAADWVADHRTVGGYDGLTPRHLSDGRRRGRYATLIYELLRGGRWAAEVARRGEQPRPGKEPRVHAILTMRDAIVMRAATVTLFDVWRRIPASIVGGRPCGDPGAVVDDVTRYMMAGGGYGLRFDIQSAYASAPCEFAYERLRLLSDRHDVIDLMEQWRRRQGDRFAGLVEGCPQGPLLLAVLLREAAAELEALGGGVLVRLWLDDGVVLARDEETTGRARTIIERHLTALGMRLHASPEKTCTFSWGWRAVECDWHFLGTRRSGPFPVPTDHAIEHLLGLPAELYRAGKAAHIEAAMRSWAAYYLRTETPEHILAELDELLRLHVVPDYGLIAPIPSLVTLQKTRSSALRGVKAPRAVVQYLGTSGGGRRGTRFSLSASQVSPRGPSSSDKPTRAARMDRRRGDESPVSGRSTSEAA